MYQVERHAVTTILRNQRCYLAFISGDSFVTQRVRRWNFFGLKHDVKAYEFHGTCDVRLPAHLLLVSARQERHECTAREEAYGPDRLGDVHSRRL
jgi:hypothetical protein